MYQMDDTYNDCNFVSHQGVAARLAVSHAMHLIWWDKHIISWVASMHNASSSYLYLFFLSHKMHLHIAGLCLNACLGRLLS